MPVNASHCSLGLLSARLLSPRWTPLSGPPSHDEYAMHMYCTKDCWVTSEPKPEEALVESRHFLSISHLQLLVSQCRLLEQWPWLLKDPHGFQLHSCNNYGLRLRSLCGLPKGEWWQVYQKTEAFQIVIITECGWFGFKSETSQLAPCRVFWISWGVRVRTPSFSTQVWSFASFLIVHAPDREKLEWTGLRIIASFRCDHSF